MFYNCCPHCGGSIGQDQVVGQMLRCTSCGKEIGIVVADLHQAAIDQTEERIRNGSAARCPACQQAVDIKMPTGSLIVHYAPGQKKICPGSGKPAASAPVAASPPTLSAVVKTPGGRDLSKYYTKDVIRVVLCRKGAAVTIEELTLEYLDKADRVRIQIEALREILGASFRMKDYPPELNKPQLAVWGHATACVIARKHQRGGYEPMAEAEIAGVVEDVKDREALFFA